MNKMENIRDTIIESFVLFSLAGTFNDFLSDTLNEVSNFLRFGVLLYGRSDYLCRYYKRK